jgi:hypothetical protein
MPFEEYAAQPFIREHEQFNYVAKICLAKSDKGYAGFSQYLQLHLLAKQAAFTTTIQIYTY